MTSLNVCVAVLGFSVAIIGFLFADHLRRWH